MKHMKTVVTFTGRSVRVLCGSASREQIQIEKMIPVPFTGNCVMNGVVTDPEIFTAGLRAVWQENKLPKKGVMLSLDGNHIRTKRVTAPAKLSAAKTAEIIPFEFLDDAPEQEGRVYSYVPVGEGEGGRELLAACADRAYVEELRTLFREAGVELQSITSSWCGFSRLLSYLEELRAQSGIVLTLQDELLSTILVENGRYTSVSMSRVFSAHGTPSFGTEIARAVNQLAQMHSTARAQSVQNVFCIGFAAEDFAVLVEPVEALGFSPAQLDSVQALSVQGGQLSDCVMHAGALVLGKNGNLLTVGDTAQLKKRERRLWLALPILLVTAVLAAVTSTLVLRNMELEKERDALQSYVEDPNNLAAEAEYNALLEESAALSRQISAAEEIRAAIESYPRAVSSINSVIEACGAGTVSVTISSYDAATGQLGFQASGPNADGLNTFVQALSEAGIFGDVTYSGYTLTGEMYDVNVFCTLRADAGR